MKKLNTLSFDKFGSIAQVGDLYIKSNKFSKVENSARI